MSIGLRIRTKTILGRDREAILPDAVGKADGTIVFAYFDVVSVMVASPRKIAYRGARTKAGLVDRIVVPCSNFAIKAARAFGCSCVVR